MVAVEFSKFVDILSAALSQHHLLGFEIAQLKFWRRQWHPTPVLLPGKPHGQRSLEGYSLWGRKESDTTEQLTLTFPLPFSVPLFDISADPEQSSNSPVLTLEIIVAFLSHLIAHI